MGDDHNDDHDDLPGQSQTQTEQTQTVQSGNESGPAESHMVVDNNLKEHERDDSPAVDVNDGNGAVVGKDEEENDQIRPQDSISNVQ